MHILICVCGIVPCTDKSTNCFLVAGVLYVWSGWNAARKMTSSLLYPLICRCRTTPQPPFLASCMKTKNALNFSYCWWKIGSPATVGWVSSISILQASQIGNGHQPLWFWGGLSGYTVKHQLDIGHEPWELECVFLILIKSHQESSKVPFPTQHANMIKCFYIFVQIIATSAGVTRRPLNWGWGITVLCPHIYIYFFLYMI